MFCPKCGKEIPAGAQTCANCGTAASGSTTVIVKQHNGGCLKGCLFAVLGLIGVVVVLAVLMGKISSDEENAAIAAQQSVSIEEATKNGEELVAWVKGKSGQTELMRNDSFARLKGKTVLLRGPVRAVGQTAFEKDYYISLTVGKVSVLERLNVQFTMRKSQYDKFKNWNVGEIHTLRGRVSGKGDFEDDAVCDLGEIVE